MSEFKIINAEIQPSVIIDAKGLHCPMPLLRIKKEINRLTSGQILQIDVTDPSSQRDFSGWCDRSGNTFLGEKDMYGYTCYFIKKG